MRARGSDSKRHSETVTARDSKIDPITTTSTSTGDSECVSKYIFHQYAAATGYRLLICFSMQLL